MKLSSLFYAIIELCISAAVHVVYGFYIFSTAVASDLSQSLVQGFKPLKTNIDEKNESGLDKYSILDATLPSSSLPPPIVLVHGIFGFGKGRLGGLSYFAGAEKKDDRVLVPDLGSLTSIHDSYALKFRPKWSRIGTVVAANLQTHLHEFHSTLHTLIAMFFLSSVAIAASNNPK